MQQTTVLILMLVLEKKYGMAFHVNNLQADNSHELSSLFCHQNEKITQNLLSVTNCAWRFKGYNIFVCLPSFESQIETFFVNRNESLHEISHNVVCATSKASDQPAHTQSDKSVELPFMLQSYLLWCIQS